MRPETPDILAPLPPVAGDPWVGWLVPTLAVGLTGLTLWYLRHRARRPLRRLDRALRRDRLGSRETAHALAAVLRDRAARDGGGPIRELLGELDALRFRRDPPSAASLLDLIGRAEHLRPRRAGDV